MPNLYNIELKPGPVYLARPRHETPWLVQSLIPYGGTTILFAPSKQGKSSAILSLAAGLADPTQEDFFGLQIANHGPVGYLQLDTPSELWIGEYVKKMKDRGGLDFTHVYFEDRDTLPPGLDPFNILVPAHAQYLTEWVHTMPTHPVAVIIDTWRTVFRGAEKDDDLTTTILHTLRKAIQPAALIIVHHARKGAEGQRTGEEGTMDEMRGSSNLSAMADVIWRLKRGEWKIRGRGGDMTIPVGFDKHTGLPVMTQQINPLIQIILKNTTFDSDRARAAELADRSGLSFEAARSALRRAKNLL